MRDIDILPILSTKDNYNRFKKFIKPQLLSEEIRTIVKDLEVWYHTNDEIDWNKFESWFKFKRHAMFKVEQLELFNKIFEELNKDSEEEEDDTTIMEALIERDGATKIAEKALAIADGDDSVGFEELGDIYDSVLDEIGAAEKVDDQFFHMSFADIDKEDEGGYDWRLEELNLSIGPVRENKLYCFAARPNSGKSTWLCSEVAYIAEQIDDGTILWLSNEESERDYYRRIMQSAIGWKELDIQAKPDEALEEVEKIYGKDLHKLKYKHVAGKSVHDLEVLIKSVKDVKLIIIDQLWKVKGFSKKTSNEVGRQEELWKWAREKSAQYATIMTVHQADAQADGHKWIDMSQLYGSKTAIQGECDVIMTMGRILDGSENPEVRGLYIARDKLRRVRRMDPAYKEGRFDLEIDWECGRLTGSITNPGYGSNS